MSEKPENPALSAAEAARVCRLYPEWCKNWGMDRNMRAATEAANEIADLLERISGPLPDDDEDAARVLWEQTDWWKATLAQRAKDQTP